jgi:DNA-binding NarL/FixJ family response regulator
MATTVRTSAPARILLADDHELVREGLALLLTGAGFKVVGSVSDGHAAVRLVQDLRPDIAILDLVMPLLNGIEAGREIARSSPETRTILLTSRDEEDFVLEALHAGFSGCVLKTYGATDLIRAIKDVLAGGSYLSAEASRSLVDAYRARLARPPDPLSHRERQVLQLLAEGKRTREVAELLGVSGKTAESHRTRIMKKLHITHTAGLVRYAIQRGLTAVSLTAVVLSDWMGMDLDGAVEVAADLLSVVV